VTNASQAVRRAKETEYEDLKLIVPRLQDHRARVEFVDQHPEYVRPDVIAKLVEWVPTLVRSDRSEAAAVVECAVLLARKVRQPQTSALALRASANLMHVSGRNKSAVRCHERAYSLFLAAHRALAARFCARRLSAFVSSINR